MTVDIQKANKVRQYVEKGGIGTFIMPAAPSQSSSRFFPVEGIDILGPGISEYEQGIARIETQPRSRIACSRKVRQIRNLLDLAVGDRHSQHSWIVQPSQEVNILSIS